MRRNKLGMCIEYWQLRQIVHFLLFKHELALFFLLFINYELVLVIYDVSGFDLLNGLMFHRLQGPIFVFLLFITSLLGAVFIIFPFVPLAYFYPKAWRFCADRFVGYWLTFPAVSFYISKLKAWIMLKFSVSRGNGVWLSIPCDG